MNIGPDYVFVCIPRTASVSLSRDWLVRYYGGVDLPAEMYHSTEVPVEHIGKFTRTVVRNPYDRLLSLYHYVLLFTEEDRTRDGIPVGCTAAEFVQWCTQTGTKDTRWFNQSMYFDRVRIDAVVHWECLENELRLLPFVHEWHPTVRQNTTVHPPYQDELKSEFIAAVNIHSALDFERFGYIRCI